MAVLVAAVILLGGLVVLNLLLTGAIIRRLRVMAREPYRGDPATPGLPVGAEVPALSAAATDGATITSEYLRGRLTLLGFFNTDCGTCRTTAPAFARAARDLTAATDGTGRAVAVISTEQEDAAELLAALGTDVTVIMERGRGPVTDAFQMSAFPWFLLIGPDGRITASASTPERCLPAPARA